MTTNQLLGTGPLPDWLRNLAHGRKMVSLDTFRDNICLWCCIAVYKGAHTDRCTQLAGQLARGYFKSDIVPRTSLNELDKVEKYLNKEKQLREWIEIRAYVPVRQENGEIYWHLTKCPSGKLKSIMTIGIYEGHAFLIKDIAKLAKTYVCNDCGGHFTQAGSLQRHAKTCRKGETDISCPEEKLNPPLTKYEMTFYEKGDSSKPATEWLEKTAKSLKIPFITRCVAMGGRDMFLVLQLMVLTRILAQSFSFTVVGGTAVHAVLPTGAGKYATARRETSRTRRQLPARRH